MANSLEKKTQLYWAMSTCYNGRSDDVITTERVLHALTDVEANLGPDRKLKQYVTGLTDEIIQGARGKPQKKKQVQGRSVSMLVIDDPYGGDAA